MRCAARTSSRHAQHAVPQRVAQLGNDYPAPRSRSRDTTATTHLARNAQPMTTTPTAHARHNSDSSLAAELTRTQAELEAAQQRIIELGETLTALGFPPDTLTLLLDQIAYTNSNAAADAVTGQHFRQAVTQAVSEARTQPAALTAATLDTLLNKLQKLNEAATAQTRRNRARTLANVTARRASIRDLISKMGERHRQGVDQ